MKCMILPYGCAFSSFIMEGSYPAYNSKNSQVQTHVRNFGVWTFFKQVHLSKNKCAVAYQAIGK